MLSTAEMQSIRAEAERWLPSTARRYVKTEVSDGAGGSGSTYTPEATTQPCRLSPVGGGEGADQGSRVSDRTTHILTLAHDAVIDEPDQIDVNGQMFEVTHVRRRPALEFVRRVEVREAG